MPRGQPPKPTALRLLQGNPGKRALPKNEPKPKGGIPRPPADLSPEARKHWRKIAKQLDEAKILTQIDGPALALYCEAYARWADANAKVIEFGTVVKGKQGYPVVSPWLQVANMAHEQMRRMLVEFGMTPSSRTRVKTTDSESKGDAWDKFASDTKQKRA